jgi:hypothetical protein
MKTIITALFISISSIAFAKGNDSICDVKSKILLPKSNFNFNTQKINLNIVKYKDNSSDDKITSGLILLIAGVAFTTASIIENEDAYGTWTKNPQPGNPYNQTWTTKPFIQQFPRNIMLVVGIGFTLTGGGIMINNK